MPRRPSRLPRRGASPATAAHCRPLGGSIAPGWWTVWPPPGEIDFATQCGPIPKVELRVRRDDDLPPCVQPNLGEKSTEKVDSLHLGIELAECRFVQDTRFSSMPAVLVDCAGAGGIVYDPAIENRRKREVVGHRLDLYSIGKLRRDGAATSAADHQPAPREGLRALRRDRSDHVQISMIKLMSRRIALYRNY